MRLRLVVATAAVSLVLPAAASANTYCVNKSPCTLGTSMISVQGALDAAAAHAGLDIVRIGGRQQEYAGPFAYDEPAFNPVQIIGDGPGQTVLAATPTEPALALGKAGSKVSNLTVLPKDPGSGQMPGAGLELNGADAENVTVLYSGANEGLTGILTHDDAELRNVHVDMSSGLALRATDGPQGTAVYNSLLSGTTGVLAASNATATLRDVRISAKLRAGWAFTGGHIRLTNVLATTSAPNSVGIEVFDSSSLEALHLTLVATATAGSPRGVIVDAASASLDNSIVHGYPMPLLRTSTIGGAQSDLSVRHTNVDLNASILGPVGGTLDLGQGIRYDNPHFAAPGDFHLRGDSPLIDAGHLTSMSDEADLDGLDRDVDADGDTNGEPDLGAFEYQRGQPIADFAFGLATAGTPVAFDASPSSDPDPGDESGFAYEWSFGDGATGSGQSPQHSYALPGDYTVGLTVTDPNGLKAATTRVVSAAAAASAGDTLAPAISRLKVLPRRNRVRFRLSEPARVTLRIVLLRSPKRARVLKLSGRAGLNSVRLPRRRVLRAGPYRLVLRAVDGAGNRSQPVRKRFRVTKP